MIQVYIHYNPYRLTTSMKINGAPIDAESEIAREMKGKRLQAWIGKLPQMLVDARKTREIEVIFHGDKLDYDDVEDAFEQAQEKKIIANYDLRFEESDSNDKVLETLRSSYDDLMNDAGNLLAEADRKSLKEAIGRVQSNVFPIHVIATMSAGKSTLINALLRKKLMPSKNEACTAIITEIQDNDEPDFSAVVFDKRDATIKTIDQLTYEEMQKLNENQDVSRVSIKGNIPFLEVREMCLKLLDTPGPNNARNANHRETTYENINSATDNLILYVLNYTQLATNDDEHLLKYIAEQIQKGGKETRDRFIFVLNKMDEVSKDDSVEHAIAVTRDYLAKEGIEDPQIFPCSAFGALGIQTLLRDLDPYDYGAIDAAVEQYNNNDIDEAAFCVRKLNRNEALHLEKYSTLVPSEREHLEEALEKAQKARDRKTEALIHSGICSIEAAIKVYVQKYAKTKKVRDFSELLEQQLKQMESEANAKLTSVSGGKDAEELRKRGEAIQAFIQKGEEAKAFKSRIEKINPVPDIQKKSQKLVDAAMRELTNMFKPLGVEIRSREEVVNFVNRFSTETAEVMASLAVDLEVEVEQKITKIGTDMIQEYQAKLDGLDKSIGDNLNFSTADLVSGVLSRMKADALEYGAGSGSKKMAELEEAVDKVHVDEKESYTEKVVKERTKKVKQFTHNEKVKKGEERVVVGTHQELVGTKKVERKRKGLFKGLRNAMFGELYDEVDDYQIVEDVEYRPIYEYVPQFKTVLEPYTEVVEEERERDVYVVRVGEMQNELITPIRRQLKEDVAELLGTAEKLVKSLKKKFFDSFDEVDRLIQSKYDELNSYSKNEKELEKKKAECKQDLSFIQDSLKEVEEALNV